jgi:hypothetical protein
MKNEEQVKQLLHVYTSKAKLAMNLGETHIANNLVPFIQLLELILEIPANQSDVNEIFGVGV